MSQSFGKTQHSTICRQPKILTVCMKYELLLSLALTPKSGNGSSLCPCMSPRAGQIVLQTHSALMPPRAPADHITLKCSHFPSFVTADTPFPYNSTAQLHAELPGGGSSVSPLCLREERCIAKGGKKGGCKEVHKVYMHLTLLGVVISQLV